VTEDRGQEKPGHGVVVRAPNGDVIRYDPTGLVMRLSDRVIEDIALRLGTAPATASPVMDRRSSRTSTPGTSGPKATGCASPRGSTVGKACAGSCATATAARSSATGQGR
jgi:hypothetical protein